MLNYDKFPTAHMRGAVERYFENRIPPGSFLASVIANDLKGAVGRADDINKEHLNEIVVWFYNEAPANAWGSPEAYDEWINPSKESNRA